MARHPWHQQCLRTSQHHSIPLQYTVLGDPKQTQKPLPRPPRETTRNPRRTRKKPPHLQGLETRLFQHRAALLFEALPGEGHQASGREAALDGRVGRRPLDHGPDGPERLGVPKKEGAFTGEELFLQPELFDVFGKVFR